VSVCRYRVVLAAFGKYDEDTQWRGRVCAMHLMKVAYKTIRICG